ncbi:hypothetical protein ACQ4PT_072184 [Festuca glaucescens]
MAGFDLPEGEIEGAGRAGGGNGGGGRGNVHGGGTHDHEAGGSRSVRQSPLGFAGTHDHEAGGSGSSSGNGSARQSRLGLAGRGRACSQYNAGGRIFGASSRLGLAGRGRACSQYNAGGSFFDASDNSRTGRLGLAGRGRGFFDVRGNVSTASPSARLGLAGRGRGQGDWSDFHESTTHKRGREEGDHVGGGGHEGPVFGSDDHLDDTGGGNDEELEEEYTTGIDLNEFANKKRRTFYSDDTKRSFYCMILARNGPGHLKFGVTKQLSQELEVPDRVLRRIWKNGLGGIGNVVNKKAGRCGRKRVELDAASLVAIPLPQRTTLRDVAANLNMSLTTVHARLQQKEFRHHTSDLKPDLTLANLKARIRYLGVCRMGTCEEEKSQSPKGTLELKPCTSVGLEKSREYLITKVLPAIKAKWPAEDRMNTIYIQQDNAKTHVQPTDPAVCAAAMSDVIVSEEDAQQSSRNSDQGEAAFQEYHANKGNRIFLTHMACMREIIRQKGSIHYALPHIKKKVMERLGILPIRLIVEPEFVQAAIEHLNS